MENNASKKRILVAPLNWGLGHATRCIPIIKELESSGFEPVIASDGAPLDFLKKEFPNLEHLELPSYNVRYASTSSGLKMKMLAQTPRFFSTIQKEKVATQKIINNLNISGIISDNRLGVQSKDVPSVYITHQINVLTGTTTWLSSKIHQHYIKKFTQCWIPDFESKTNLSGKLSHSNKKINHLKYIGPISRLQNNPSAIKYDVMVVLSGLEPQRTLLEKKLKQEFSGNVRSVLFVKGVIEDEQKSWQEKNITFYNYMNSKQLENAFNESNIVVCRSGYSTIMDLVRLKKNAFFIPTPGQYEQEYLAKRLKHHGFVSFCKQDDFKVAKLDEVNLYKGLHSFNIEEVNWKKLFKLF